MRVFLLSSCLLCLGLAGATSAESPYFRLNRLGNAATEGAGGSAGAPDAGTNAPTGPQVSASAGRVDLVEGDAYSVPAPTSLAGATWSVSGGPAATSVSPDGRVSIVASDVDTVTEYTLRLRATLPDGTTPVSRDIAVQVAPAAASLSSLKVRSAQRVAMPVSTTMRAAGAWSLSGDSAGLSLADPSLSSTSVTGTAPAVAGPEPTVRTLSAAFVAGVSGAVARTPAATVTIHPALAVTAEPYLIGEVGSPASFAAPGVIGKVGKVAYGLYQGDTDISDTLGTQCPGLSFDRVSGTVSGTPTGQCYAAATYRVADDGAGDPGLSAVASSEETVVYAGDPTISVSRSYFSVTEGDTVAFEATTSMPNPTWSVTGKPAWMTLIQSGGRFATSGPTGDVPFPNYRDDYLLTLVADNGIARVTKPVTVSVSPGTLTFPAPAGVRSGRAFSTPVGTNIKTPTWSVTASPAGMAELAVVGGRLQGVAPVVAVSSPYTLKVAVNGASVPAGNPATANSQQDIYVVPPLSFDALANATRSVGDSVYLPPPPIRFAQARPAYEMYRNGAPVSVGDICPGLSLTGFGSIEGTASAPCQVTLAYKATDDAGGQAGLADTAMSASFTLTILP